MRRLPAGYRGRMDRRDRHGRGMRGPLARPPVPLSRSRSEEFGDLVDEAARRVASHLGEDTAARLASVQVRVEEVPPDPEAEAVAVALGRLDDEAAGRPATVVVYRRPVLLRSETREDRAALVQDVVVEQIAELLGMDVDDVDPGPPD